MASAGSTSPPHAFRKLKVNAFGNADSTYMAGPTLSPHPDSDGRRRHQYDAAGRLTLIERLENAQSSYSYRLEQRYDSSGNAIERFVHEEYRYDALGRRSLRGPCARAQAPVSIGYQVR